MATSCGPSSARGREQVGNRNRAGVPLSGAAGYAISITNGVPIAAKASVSSRSSITSL